MIKFKKTKNDIIKMQKRYDYMFNIYKQESLDKLKELYKIKKSRTDQAALEDAALYVKMKEMHDKQATNRDVE